jgi:hypothetical protein
MSPTLILDQKVLTIGPKATLFIRTQIRHLTLKQGFIWCVCFYSFSFSNLFFVLQTQVCDPCARRDILLCKTIPIFV